MKQSDVTKMLKQYGHERGTMHVLMRLAEEQGDMQNTITEMAEVMHRMSHVLEMHNTVMDNMKDRIDKDADIRSTLAIARGDGDA
jgi:GTP-binding protein EngB required for normal cell division